VSAEAIVQRQLDAYNAQDLTGFTACYAEDVVIADFNGPVTQTGRAELEARYAAMFAANPKNRADLVGRMALGSVVVDHERVFRDGATAAFEALAIYTVKDGVIARVDFVKAGS